MLKPRVIPCLLLKGQGLVKGVKYHDHRYVGDPINAVHIFNSKEVDEIVFLDITATAEKRTPDPEVIQRIADQCLVPFAVGGGIRSVDDAALMMKSGAEKVIINTAAFERPELVGEIASRFGSQSVVVSIDVKKNFFGKYELVANAAGRKVGGSIEEWIDLLEKSGAGEFLVNAIDRDGTREGYDLKLIQKIRETSKIPVIAGCGAGSLDHMRAAIKEGGAHAVAAGSQFVFHGRRQAVLISYPDEAEISKIVS